MSYDDFQEFLKQAKGVDFYKEILPQIKQSVADTFEALSSLLEDQSRAELGANNSCFELFGYDFMMDDDLKLAMIEVNTNPCLETESSPLLSRLISQVVDQTFKVAVDPLFDGNENDIGLS
jgi:tubulin monoglycylase TTLL3/8